MMRPSLFMSLWRPFAGLLLLLGLWVLPGLVRSDDFLDPELAFKLSVKPLDERSLEVRFDIAPGYYMYREQFKAESAEATLAALDIPKGKVKFDETFQKEVEIYRDALVVKVPVEQATGAFKLSWVAKVVLTKACAIRR